MNDFERGLGIELEEMGVVALVGLVLIPGFLWISRAKSGAGTLVRGAMVAGLLAGALLVERTMDRTANAVAEEI
jgi:hypothetical protein